MGSLERIYPEFRNGFISLFSLQLYLLPVNGFLFIFHIIFGQKDSDEVLDLVSRSTYKDAYVLYSLLKDKKENDTRKINDFLACINSLGIGEIKLKQKGSSKIVFVIEHTYLSNLYRKLFDEDPKVLLEVINVSFLKHFICFLYGKEIEARMRKLGNDSLIVELFFTDGPFLSDGIDYEYESISDMLVEVPSSLKKILLNNHIIIEKGKFCLWNVYGTLIPYFFLIDLTNDLDDEGKRELRKFGLMIGKMAVDFQRKLFGFQNEKVFSQVLDQPNINGTGYLNIKSRNPFEFELINNLSSYFLKYYEREKVGLVKTFFENILVGMYEFSYDVKSSRKDHGSLIFLDKVSEDRGLDEIEKKIYKYINPLALITHKQRDK